MHDTVENFNGNGGKFKYEMKRGDYFAIEQEKIVNQPSLQGQNFKTAKKSDLFFLHRELNSVLRNHYFSFFLRPKSVNWPIILQSIPIPVQAQKT